MFLTRTMHHKSDLPWIYCEIPAVLAGVLYLNTLPAAFVYDDNRAILANPDVLEKTSLVSVFYNDFWGTPLNHPGSHRSYRPLCILTFRLNHMIGGLNPTGYHLVNILLHSMVSALFVKTVWKIILSPRVGAIAGLLFASHSVHTEAVAGIVGRAELLSALFFLLAFNCFVNYNATAQLICSANKKLPVNSSLQDNCKNGRVKFNSSITDSNLLIDVDKSQKCIHLLGFILFSVLAMLSKEQGITVCGFAAVWSVLCQIQSINRNWAFLKRMKHLLNESLITSCGVATLLGFFRFYIMKFQQPEFSAADNPAANSDDLFTRTWTFLYLPSFNFWLLLAPVKLSFDWSMDAIPLVKSFSDYRLYFVLLFYTLLAIITSISLMSLCQIYCKHPNRYCCNGSRNGASIRNGSSSLAMDELQCKYDDIGCNTAAVKCNSNVNEYLTTHHSSDDHVLNEKSRELANGNNVDNSSYLDFSITNFVSNKFSAVLSNNSESSSLKSSDCYHATHCKDNSESVSILMAISLLVIPFIPSTNLLFYVGFVVAERVLYIPSMGHCLLVSIGFNILYETARSLRINVRVMLRVLIVSLVVCLSWRTVQRNKDWLSEYNLYVSGVQTNPAKAWGNLANILRGEGQLREAEEAYKQALYYRSNMADVHYNLGILYQSSGQFQESMLSYRNAIKCRPNLSPALLNLGLVYVSLGNHVKAEEMFRACNRTRTDDMKDPRLHDHAKISCLYHLGRLLADSERVPDAIIIYNEAVSRLVPDFPSHSLYNMLGEAYAKLNEISQAEHYYKLSLQLKPDHIPAHLTLARLLHQQNEDKHAEEWFQKAERLDPSDENVHQFYGFFLAELGRYAEAAEHYLIAAQKQPDNFQVISNAANMLRMSGRNAEAEDYYKKAVSIKPKKITAIINLGAILHYNGKLIEAEKVYVEGLQLNPNDPTLINNLNKLRRLLAKRNHNKAKVVIAADED